MQMAAGNRTALTYLISAAVCRRPLKQLIRDEHRMKFVTDAERILKYAKSIGTYLREDNVRRAQIFLKSFITEIRIGEEKGTIRYTVPMPPRRGFRAETQRNWLSTSQFCLLDNPRRPGCVTVSVSQDPGHGQLGVVVQDAPGHSAQEGKCRHVAVQESLGGLGRVSLDEASVAMGRSRTKQWAFCSTPPMITRASPKSHWACPGGWDRGTNISCDRRRCSLT